MIIEDGIKYITTDTGKKFRLFDPLKDWCPGIISIKTTDESGTVIERNFKKAKNTLMATLAARQKQIKAKFKNKAAKKARKKNRKKK